MKKVNLAKAMCKNKKCIGYVYQTTKGHYDIQNDNDLGLDLEGIAEPMTYTKKVYVGNGYYFYVMRGLWGKTHTEVTLSMAKILLKECHSILFTLTPREKARAKKYWAQF